MKQVKMALLLIIVCISNNSKAQTKVEIGDLYYLLTGTTASVAQNKDISYSNSTYTKNSYIIPSMVSYKGLDYVVNKIGDNAFTGGSSAHSSTASVIVLPNTIEAIGESAFQKCKNLTQFIVPSSVQIMGKDCFKSCDILRRIIYLPATAPTNWVATDLTYVPDKLSYSSPSQRINNARVYEMISFDQYEFVYTGHAPTTTWVNNVDGYTASLSMPTLNGDVGSHVERIPVTFTKGNESFTANVVYRYTIKPASLTAKVENVSREYGEDNPQFDIIYSGFVNGEDESVLSTNPTISTTATNRSNVGDYPIIISGGVATNYDIVYEPGILTITKAPLFAIVNDTTKIYGSNNPSFTINYSGLKNGETVPAWTTSPTFRTEATKQSGVGEYAVNAINGVPKNYDLGTITPGTLTVTPAPLTIKANNATRLYYNDNPTFSYTCNGFVNSENNSVLSPAPTLSTTATQSSDTGTYEIKVEGASSPNYSISYQNGTLTVTPRTLMASVGNYSRLYNEENPEFEILYSGFAGNEDEGVLNEAPVASTTATKTSNVGTYTIKVSGGNADNYTFSYTSGTLTINKAEQTISWNQDLSNLNVGDQVELQAVASSGLPITYTMDNSSFAEIYSTGSKYYLDCLAEGQFTIRAVQSGNNNYYSSPRANKSVTIIGNVPPSDPTLTINQADNGTISMQVSKGETYTFTIAANYGWKIHSVMFNNTDVTNHLSNDGKYTTPAINNNSWLSVVYENIDEDALTSLAESNVKIQGTSFGARVIDAEMGDMIRVYTTDGKLQHSVKVESSRVDIPLEKDNIYIIQVGTKTMKMGY